MQNELQVFAGSLIGLSLRFKGIKLFKKKKNVLHSLQSPVWHGHWYKQKQDKDMAIIMAKLFLHPRKYNSYNSNIWVSLHKILDKSSITARVPIISKDTSRLLLVRDFTNSEAVKSGLLCCEVMPAWMTTLQFRSPDPAFFTTLFRTQPDQYDTFTWSILDLPYFSVL